MANLLKKLKPILSIVLVILIILGIVFVFAPKEKQKSRLVYEKNLTQTPKEIPPDAVHPGELITINFELSIPEEDGKIIDTNNGELARKSGLKTFTDGKLQMIVGKSGKVKGFDNALIGLKVGETKELIIPPSEPKTIYTIDKTREFARNQQVPKKQVFSKANFEKLFGKNHKVNDIVTNAKFPWKYQVINISKSNVGAQAIVDVNQEFVLPGLQWKSRVLNVDDYSFMVRHNPTAGQLMATGLGPAKINLTVGKIVINYDVVQGQLVNYSKEVMGIKSTHLFKVSKVEDKTLTLVRDDNPAEKTLQLKVTVLSRLPVFYDK